MTRRGCRREAAGAMLAVALVMALVWGLAFPGVIGKVQGGDASQNAKAAWHLARYGTFGSAADGAGGVLPGYWREPAYPALLASALLLRVDSAAFDLQCLLTEPECAAVRRFLKRVNLLLLTAFGVLVAVAARALSGSWLAGALAAGALLAVDIVPYDVTLSELPAALLLLGHSLLLWVALRSRRTSARIATAALAGLTLALLVLTKAIFQFWLLLAVVAASVLWVAGRGRAVPGGNVALLVFVLAGTTPVLAWMTRNYIHFGDFAVSGRAAEILAIRAEFDLATPAETLAAFGAFAPAELRWLRDRIAGVTGAQRMALFDRDNPEGFYARGKEKTGVVAARARVIGGGQMTEESLAQAARETIFGHLPGHLAMTFAFGWRGAFVDVSMHRGEPEWAEAALAEIRYWVRRVRLLFIPGLLLLAVLALRSRDSALLLFTVPALYSFAMHAAFTHYIPRYSAPLAGVAMVALATMLACVVAGIWRRAGRRGVSAGEADRGQPGHAGVDGEQAP